MRGSQFVGEWWALMQHHGAPPRLPDWTLSPWSPRSPTAGYANISSRAVASLPTLACVVSQAALHQIR
ncbi:MAG: FRG domain-containing protein [Phycisphaerae bacterium]|nr:FRG domain-containing protein [Gemmatimonadaceae bacterium]